MKPFAHATACAMTLLATLCAAPVAPAPVFRDHDRWVAVGDSITEGGAYLHYVELFHVLREPRKTIRLVNAGISGDTAEAALNRYAWDIAPSDAPRPTVATVMFGMNDCNRDLYAPDTPDDEAAHQRRRQAIDRHAAHLARLLDRLLADGIRPIVLTPSPFDDTSRADMANLPGCNTALAECALRARALAAERDLAVIDLHGPLTALMHRLQATDPRALPFGGDRVHPGPDGHLAMAYQILRAQHPAGPFVQVHLRAAPAGVRFARGARVESLAAHADGGLAFDYTAESLPFVIPTEAEPARAWTPLFSELNREEFRFLALPAERYQLHIDQKLVGEFSRADLAHGVNLAAHPTPQRAQAEAVLTLLQQRWALMARLRRIAQVEHWQAKSEPRPITLATMEPILHRWETVLRAEPASWQAAHPAEYRAWKPDAPDIAARADALLDQARAAAQPVTRRVTLTPLAPSAAPAEPTRVP